MDPAATKPLVSIIIPVYRAGGTLPRCLESFLCQTFRGIEILCVNDASTDDSLEIMKRYEARDRRVRAIDLASNSGAAVARNTALAQARGEYLMFADADDHVEPDIVRLCLEAVWAHDADFACVGFDRVDVSGRSYSREQAISACSVIDVTPESVSRLAFVYTAPWGKLFKRELIGEVRFPENPVAAYEDAVFFLALCPKIRRYVLLPNLLYHYVVHAGSLNTQASRERSSFFRRDLLALRNAFTHRALPPPYLAFLDLAAFIHVGIADAHRSADVYEADLRAFCRDARAFLDSEFPGWRNIPLCPWGEWSLRCAAVYFSRLLHHAGWFWLFVRFYNWMIKTLHVDVKW
jgi:glycosyltransferase involved in cell wall biosynthesis